TLRAISGHRDTYPTSCPGNNVYAQLPSITRQVAATGLPKIYSPIVIGGLGGNVRFTARLSSDVPWTVSVRNALGELVASGTGTSHLVDWTWDASLSPSGSYRYTIAAGSAGAAAARPVTGTVGEKLPSLSVTQFRVSPTVVSPNADGIGDTAQINYFLSVSAPITMTLFNGAGQRLAPLSSGMSGQVGRPFAGRRFGVGTGRYTTTIPAGRPPARRGPGKPPSKV